MRLQSNTPSSSFLQAFFSGIWYQDREHYVAFQEQGFSQNFPYIDSYSFSVKVHLNALMSYPLSTICTILKINLQALGRKLKATSWSISCNTLPEAANMVFTGLAHPYHL